MGSLVAVVVFLFPIVPDSTNNLKSQIWPTITTSPTHLDGRYQLLLPSAYYQLSNLKWMVKIEWNVLSSGATFYSISFSFPFFFFLIDSFNLWHSLLIKYQNTNQFLVYARIEFQIFYLTVINFTN